MGQFEWDPNAGTNDWANKKNWSPEGVPGRGDDVVVFPAPIIGHDNPTAKDGTAVRTLLLGRGGISGKIRVRQSFEWRGGVLSDGLDLDSATLTVTGHGDQRLHGGTLRPLAADFSDCDLTLGYGAELSNSGSWTFSGDNTVAVSGGLTPAIRNKSTLRVTAGSTNIAGSLLVWLGGRVEIGGSGSLALRRGGYFILDAEAAIRGDGRLVITDGGRLLTIGSAKVARPGTIELAEGGGLDGDNARIRNSSIIGQIAAKQALAVDGTLLCTGGVIDGSVTVNPKGQLRVSSGSVGRIGDGIVVVLGEFVAESNSVFEGDNGQLSLRGVTRFSRGCVLTGLRAFVVENKGRILIADRDIVRFDDAPISNAGSIEISRGELHLDGTNHTLTQPRGGSIVISSRASIRTEATLSLAAGSLVAHGQIVGNVAQHGTTIIGGLNGHTLSNPGRLDVHGDYAQIGAASGLRVRASSYQPETGHGFLDVTGTVQLDGTLTLEMPSTFAPVVNDQLDLIRSHGTDIVGRFTKIKGPRPSEAGNAATYFRVAYDGTIARLVGSAVHLGFDALSLPAQADRDHWLNACPYEWAGYYLNAPCQRLTQWPGHRAEFHNRGMGLAVIYVGQQERNIARCPHILTRAQGATDGGDAIVQANNDQFPAGTWIYLDIEHVPGRLDPGMIEYIQSWFRTLLDAGIYNPAIYCSIGNAAEIANATATVFAAAGRHDRPRFWVTGGPANAGRITDPPWWSGIPEAIVWQQPPYDRPEQYGNYVWHIDRNVSALADPSGPEPARRTVTPPQ